MKIDKYKERVDFCGEDGDRLSVMYSNRGDPYSEGVDIEVECYEKHTFVYLEGSEAKKLRDLLNRLYPIK